MDAKARDRRVAVVTGSASGLGWAVVDLLRSNRWHVAGIDRVQGDADLSLTVDVGDPTMVDEAFVRVDRRFGRIDAVVNCAGIVRNDLTPVHALSDAVWSETLRVNLTGSFHVARAALPFLVASSGTLILIASTAARHPQPGAAAYSVSKAGVRALTEAIALEYAPKGVRACSVSPGYMQTPMTAAVLARDALRARIEEGIPLGRVAQPSEVAETVLFLLGAGGAFITGQDVMVDGGGALTAYVFPGDTGAMWSRFGGRAT